MKIETFLVILLVSSIFLILGCSDKPDQPVVIKSYPVKNLDGFLTQEGVEVDRDVSSDGNGSIKIVAPESTTVRLYEAGDIDIENVRLAYQAKIRAENVIGQAFLEMWCVFEGKGEFFSRGLRTLVTSDTDWKDTETMFYLKAGENPDNIKLNLVINGSGTVWIDDIKLVKHPLRRDEQL
ncbi:MAG: hypothetical protein JSU85_08735 [Candidatus Zixiibacteriota bacterium]|nr:MAG: hypothetical protein JSU85_08735 [candidate division Zixibacteria bacterium]